MIKSRRQRADSQSKINKSSNGQVISSKSKPVDWLAEIESLTTINTGDVITNTDNDCTGTTNLTVDAPLINSKKSNKMIYKSATKSTSLDTVANGCKRNTNIDSSVQLGGGVIKSRTFYSSSKPRFVPFLERVKIKELKLLKNTDKSSEGSSSEDSGNPESEATTDNQDCVGIDNNLMHQRGLEEQVAVDDKEIISTGDSLQDRKVISSVIVEDFESVSSHDNSPESDKDLFSCSSDERIGDSKVCKQIIIDCDYSVTADGRKRTRETPEDDVNTSSESTGAKKQKVSPTRKVNQMTLTNFFTSSNKKNLTENVITVEDTVSEMEYDIRGEILSDKDSVCSVESFNSGPGSANSCKIKQFQQKQNHDSKSSRTESPLTRNRKPRKKLTPSWKTQSEEFSLSDLVLGSSEFSEILSTSSKEGVSSSPSLSSSSEYNPSVSLFTSESSSDSQLSPRQASPNQVTSIMDYFGTSKWKGIKEGLTPPGSPGWRSKVTSGRKNSPRENKKLPATKKQELKKMEQMYLDIGQRDFGHVTCQTCGMVYTCAQPEDEADHIRFHKKLVNGLKFKGWKTEHVVQHCHDGRIIVILPEDNKLHLKKVAEVHQVVDSELGFVVDGSLSTHDVKTFLFIANKKVVGCAIVKDIDKGYRVLPGDNLREDDSEESVNRQLSAWCCSTTPEPVQCGISRIWVFSQVRRQQIATRLIDSVRNNLIFGCVIPKSEIAFSDPTPDGKIFAQKYTGTPEFLVFR